MQPENLALFSRVDAQHHRLNCVIDLFILIYGTIFFLCIASVLSRVTCIQTNLDEEPETVREEFHNFLAKVISNWTDKRDQEELSIMNTWSCLLSEEPRVFHLVYRIEFLLFFFWWLVIIYFPLSKVIWQLKTTLVLSLVENFMKWQMLRVIDRLSRKSSSISFFFVMFFLQPVFI